MDGMTSVNEELLKEFYVEPLVPENIHIYIYTKDVSDKNLTFIKSFQKHLESNSLNSQIQICVNKESIQQDSLPNLLLEDGRIDNSNYRLKHCFVCDNLESDWKIFRLNNCILLNIKKLPDYSNAELLTLICENREIYYSDEYLIIDKIVKKEEEKIDE